jgi:hypothetical protein
MIYTLVVDVSHYQPIDIDWKALYEAGVRGALIQLSHGTRPELHAYEHYNRANEANILTAFYHFLMPYPSDPVSQAGVFNGLLPYECRIRGGRMGLDCEDEAVTSAMIQEFVNSHYATYPSYFVSTMIYTRPDWWNRHIPDTELFWRYYELWLAGGPVYNQPVSKPPENYTFESPWPWNGQPSLIQFTGKGRLWKLVDGHLIAAYNGDLDLSFFPGTEDEFRLWWTQEYNPGPLPIPGDTIMPITQAKKDALTAFGQSLLIDANAQIKNANALLAEITAIQVDPVTSGPLFMATVLQSVKIRDVNGSDTGTFLAIGTQVAIYKENVTAGTFTNRAVVNLNGNNIVMTNGGLPTYSKI